MKEKSIIVRLTPEDEVRLRKTVDSVLVRLITVANTSSDGSTIKWAKNHIPNLSELSKLLGGKGC